MSQSYRFTSRRLAAADIAARVRAWVALIDSGIPDAEARALAGLPD